MSNDDGKPMRMSHARSCPKRRQTDAWVVWPSGGANAKVGIIANYMPFETYKGKALPPPPDRALAAVIKYSSITAPLDCIIYPSYPRSFTCRRLPDAACPLDQGAGLHGPRMLVSSIDIGVGCGVVANATSASAVRSKTCAMGIRMRPTSASWWLLPSCLGLGLRTLPCLRPPSIT